MAVWTPPAVSFGITSLDLDCLLAFFANTRPGGQRVFRGHASRAMVGDIIDGFMGRSESNREKSIYVLSDFKENNEIYVFKEVKVVRRTSH